MRKINSFLTLLIIFSLSSLANNSYARIFKCTNSGKTFYSDRPCVGKQENIKIHSGPKYPAQNTSDTTPADLVKTKPIIEQDIKLHADSFAHLSSSDFELLTLDKVGYIKLVRDYSNSRVLIQVLGLDKRVTTKTLLLEPRVNLYPNGGGVIGVNSQLLYNPSGVSQYIATHDDISKIENKSISVSFRNPETSDRRTSTYSVNFQN